MITATSTTNAPGTTIQVHSLCINYVQNDNFFNLSVRLLDGYGQLIRLPQPARPMNPTERATFDAVTATSGETIAQLIARAAAPYIAAVYGVTYTTV